MDELAWLGGTICKNFRPFAVWFFRWSVKYGLPDSPLFEGDEPPLLLRSKSCDGWCEPMCRYCNQAADQAAAERYL